MAFFLDIIETGQAFNLLNRAKGMAFNYVPKLAGAILIYVIGSWVINKLSRIMQQTMRKKQYDASLQTFLFSFVKVSLTILLLLTIFSTLGVNLTAFGALLAGLGLAIGTALNGSLGNFAGGIMMLIFKPFKVGDLIEAQGQTGVVKELGIFNTILLSAEHKTVILANGALSTGTITNYTSHGNLRVDIAMAIAPDQDIENAKKIALETITDLPGVLKTPEPGVSVGKIGDGMVVFNIRPFALQPDYWTVYSAVQQSVKAAWDKAGVRGPVPHVVHINKAES